MTTDIKLEAHLPNDRWSGPQRTYWIAMVKVPTLAAAARRKLAHHRKRLVYWEKELAKALKAVKGSVEIRSHQVTGGVQHNAVMDQEKAQYLETCRKKVADHEQQIILFTAYVGLLAEIKSGELLPVSHADAELFGLGERESAAGE